MEFRKILPGYQKAFFGEFIFGGGAGVLLKGILRSLERLGVYCVVLYWIVFKRDFFTERFQMRLLIHVPHGKTL